MLNYVNIFKLTMIYSKMHQADTHADTSVHTRVSSLRSCYEDLRANHRLFFVGRFLKSLRTVANLDFLRQYNVHDSKSVNNLL